MGIPTLIKTLTAADDASLSFVDGTDDVVLDSTYDEYMFVFTDINPVDDNVDFQFQVNATDDAGGGYDTSTITSTFFESYHQEAGEDIATGPGYRTALDQANGTAFQVLAQQTGNGSDESCAGIMNLYSPASTTYVKHFTARFNHYDYRNTTYDTFLAGYINDTTAIDEIQFKFSSGNFDGVIQLFGIS